MKKLVLVTFLLFAIMAIQAQNLKFVSCIHADNSTEARTKSVRDQNGDPCAIIKVRIKGGDEYFNSFSFENGNLGVIDTKKYPEKGEYWVYVPKSTKYLSILNKKLTSDLDRQPLGLHCESSEVYIMTVKIVNNEGTTYNVKENFAEFNINAPESNLSIKVYSDDGDTILIANKDGSYIKRLPLGHYTYHINDLSSLYHNESGIFEVVANQKSQINLTLKPSFGLLKLIGPQSMNGAFIFIDDKQVGTLSETGFTSANLLQGTHTILVTKEMFKDYKSTVFIHEGQTTTQTITPNADFGYVTINSPLNAEIWIDGTLKGTGRWQGELQTGNYTIECKKDRYTPSQKEIQIKVGENGIINLDSPTPILGILCIESNPSGATIIIDGNTSNPYNNNISYGTTPNIINNVLIGKHIITLNKKGYSEIKKVATVIENQETNISTPLSTESENNSSYHIDPTPSTTVEPISSTLPAEHQTSLNIETLPTGAKVKVNNKVKVSPCIFDNLSIGKKYKVSASMDGYETANSIVNIKDAMPLSYTLKLYERYTYKSGIFADFGYPYDSNESTGGFQVNLGMIKNHHVLELSYTYNTYENQNYGQSYDQIDLISVTYGYRLLLGHSNITKRLSFTPSLGIGSSQKSSYKTDPSSELTFVISAKLNIHFTKWIGMFLQAKMYGDGAIFCGGLSTGI